MKIRKLVAPVAAGVLLTVGLTVGPVTEAQAVRSHEVAWCQMRPVRWPATARGTLYYNREPARYCRGLFPKLAGRLGYDRVPRNVRFAWVLG